MASTPAPSYVRGGVALRAAELRGRECASAVFQGVAVALDGARWRYVVRKK
jgi:hypothetical protein